jgi:hypothetical protein
VSAFIAGKSFDQGMVITPCENGFDSRGSSWQRGNRTGEAEIKRGLRRKPLRLAGFALAKQLPGGSRYRYS